MKIIKIKKDEYTNIEKLLIRTGLVEEDKNVCYPDCLYVSEATYKHFKRKITQEYKKQNSFYSKKRLEYAVGIYMLNVAPNVLSNKNGGNVLPFGYAIILDKNLRLTTP